MRSRHEQLGYQGGPSRLMRCADASAGVAVKIFIERNAILVIGIQLQLRLMAHDRPIAHAVLQEDSRQTMRELVLPPSWEELRSRLKRNIRESLRHCCNSLKSAPGLAREWTRYVYKGRIDSTKVEV